MKKENAFILGSYLALLSIVVNLFLIFMEIAFSLGDWYNIFILSGPTVAFAHLWWPWNGPASMSELVFGYTFTIVTSAMIWCFIGYVIGHIKDRSKISASNISQPKYIILKWLMSRLLIVGVLMLVGQALMMAIN